MCIYSVVWFVDQAKASQNKSAGQNLFFTYLINEDVESILNGVLLSLLTAV